MNSYCINLYLGDIYYGCCALVEDGRQITNSDRILFQEFSDYIRTFLIRQQNMGTDQFITLKTVFNSILNQIPLSKKEKEHALLLRKNILQNGGEQNGNWFCTVIKNIKKQNSLPADYKCYLDNTCNIAKTARALYIHRSTLLSRLKKIEEYVCLDTAENRLYAQICTHLMEKLTK